LSKLDSSKGLDYTTKVNQDTVLKFITTDEHVKSRVFKDFNLSNFTRKDYLQVNPEDKLQKIDNSSNIDNTYLSSNTSDSSNLSSINKVSKRKFHTSATKFNSKKNQSFPIILAPRAINMKEKSIISGYSTSSLGSEENNNNFELILDNSKNESFLNRKSDISKIYKKIYLTALTSTSDDVRK